MILYTYVHQWALHDIQLQAVLGVQSAKWPTAHNEPLVSTYSNKTSVYELCSIYWIRCLIGFALLRATILCLRGARSSANQAIRNNVADCPMDLAICEGKI